MEIRWGKAETRAVPGKRRTPCVSTGGNLRDGWLNPWRIIFTHKKRWVHCEIVKDAGMEFLNQWKNRKNVFARLKAVNFLRGFIDVCWVASLNPTYEFVPCTPCSIYLARRWFLRCGHFPEAMGRINQTRQAEHFTAL